MSCLTSDFSTNKRALKKNAIPSCNLSTSNILKKINNIEDNNALCVYQSLYYTLQVTHLLVAVQQNS